MEAFLKDTVRQAGKIALEFFRRGVSVTTKSADVDFLTEADTTVSEFLVSSISAQFPGHAIKSEELEHDVNPGAEYEWVIDPIDGTRNFASGIPFWSVMVAVLRNGETIMSAIYFAAVDDFFFAKKGEGAFLNDKQIHISKADVLDHKVYMLYAGNVMGPYGTHVDRYRRARMNMQMQYENTQRQLGCISQLCYVAKGAIDVGAGNAGMDWDLLPTLFMCQEAGAIVTDSDGNPWKRGRQDYVIANEDLHPKLLALFEYEQK